MRKGPTHSLHTQCARCLARPAWQAMFSIIRRKARKESECPRCPTQTAAAAAAAALGMAVELTEPRRSRFTMYYPLPAPAVPGVLGRRRLPQLLAHAAAVAARCCFLAAAVLVLGWLLFLGSPLHWRIATGAIKLPASAHTLYESRVLGMVTRDLVCLCLAPAALALSAVATLALQPTVQQQQQQLGLVPTSPVNRWASRLLPPR